MITLLPVKGAFNNAAAVKTHADDSFSRLRGVIYSEKKEMIFFIARAHPQPRVLH